MAQSLKKFGVDGKKRFSVKYPDGRIDRFGTCDPKEDERFDIAKAKSTIEYKYYMAQYQKDDTNYSKPIVQTFLLPDGVLVANGYYDHEHDEWVTPEEWMKQA